MHILRCLSMPSMPYCSMHMPVDWNGLCMPSEVCSTCIPILITNFMVRHVEQTSVSYMMKVILWEWESLEIKDSDYRNHLRFTFRCLSKDLIPVSVRLKSTVNTRRSKQIIYKAERQLLQDRVKEINDILWDNLIKLDRCRSRLSSKVTIKQSKSVQNS